MVVTGRCKALLICFCVAPYSLKVWILIRSSQVACLPIIDVVIMILNKIYPFLPKKSKVFRVSLTILLPVLVRGMVTWYTIFR